jgi:peptidoglycan hydrolase-like protein with peptidoglycan-binding domain
MTNEYPDFIVLKLKNTIRVPYSNSYIQKEANLNQVGLSELTKLFNEFRGTTIERLFSVPEEEIVNLQREASEHAWSKEFADESKPSPLLSYFRIVPSPNIDVKALLMRLKQMDFVEEAYMEEKPVPAPFINPSNDVLAGKQGYESSAPAGIDAHFAWTLRGGDGKGIGFVDLERTWTLNHEDLISKGVTKISGINLQSLCTSEHGTMVLGVVIGTDNDRGVVGIATNVGTTRIVSAVRSATPFRYSVSDAILSAITQLRKDAKETKKNGDILLIEQQTDEHAPMEGEDPKSKIKFMMPVEVIPAAFDAIYSATNSGIVVIEAAANGKHNLSLLKDLKTLDDCGKIKLGMDTGADLDQYKDSNGKQVLNRDKGYPDFKESGAIMVGAARSEVPHERMPFSNFGSRVDCFAWGENVMTAGDNSKPKSLTDYTKEKKLFAGTSSASAIIAGVALSVQGISDAYLGTRFKSINMRSRLSLRLTGTESANPPEDRIGVMPDLKKIIIGAMGLTQDIILRNDLKLLIKNILQTGFLHRKLCSSFARAMNILYMGSTGRQVEFLQRALAHLKLSDAPFNGTFGQRTRAAVLQFQASQGLSTDGKVGPNTWGALCDNLSFSKSAIELCPPFARAMNILYLGSTGRQVEFLQRALAHLKHFPGPFDGIFGKMTGSAVLQFQASQGLSTDGKVGPNTWGALCSTISRIRETITRGSFGPEVRVLQHILSKKGIDPGSVNGIFGDTTLNAVRIFQEKLGIPVSGIVDSQTWENLIREELNIRIRR